MERVKEIEVNPYVYPGINRQDIINQIKISGGHEGLPITKEMILEVCTSVINKINDTDILPEQVKERNRKRELVEIRHCATYFMRKLLDSHWTEIGRFFLGRDHSTAINSHNKWDDQSSLHFNNRIHQINNAVCRAFGVPEMHK